MATQAQSTADHTFFTRFTKWVLGKGGIIWEQAAFLIRSSTAAGTSWSVADDNLTREERLTELNTNWRGGFDLETDPNRQSPRYEVSWRGQPARNFFDWEGWENKPYVALNGNLYDDALAPGGDVLGGFVFTPDNPSDPTDNVPWLYVITVSSGTRGRRKKLDDLSNDTIAWEDLGILPGILGTNTDQTWLPYNIINGPLGTIGDMYAHPDGTEFVAVWGRRRNVSNLQPMVGTVYYRWTVAADGLSFTNTNADETAEATIEVVRSGANQTSTVVHSFTYPINSLGQGSDTLDISEGTDDRTETGTLEQTVRQIRMGADYRPDGTLVFFDITVRLSACTATLTSSTTVGPESFEGPFDDSPRVDFWRHEWSWSSFFSEIRTFDWSVDANFDGFNFDFSSITYDDDFTQTQQRDYETSKISEIPSAPGTYYWNGTAQENVVSSSTSVQSFDARGEWEFTELHLCDLRYGTIVYTRIREKNLPAVNLRTSGPVGDYEFTTIVAVNGAQTTMWPWDDCSPVGHGNRGRSVLNYRSVVEFYLPLQFLAETEVYPVDFIKPIYNGTGTYPDDPLYSGLGLGYGSIMGFNTHLSRFVRAPDDETDSAVTHFNATNPKGGFVIIIPSVRDDIGDNAIPPIADPELKLYGKFTDDVLTLLNNKLAAQEPPGTPIVLSQTGHKFVFTPE